MRKVLIIEDNIDINLSLKEIFEQDGYEAEVAFDGQEAINKIKSMTEKPCLILLDLMMSPMNGWEFMAHVTKEALLPGVPIVVISAVHNKDTLPGTIQFIAKPFSVDQALSLCDTYCKKTL